MWTDIAVTTDWAVWCIMAMSVAYVGFFAMASLLPERKRKDHTPTAGQARFLVLFPAYKEDSVIVSSVKTFLKQDCRKEMYRVGVISDHMQADTNSQLAALPITLHMPTFTKSSKAKALQYAIENTEGEFTHVVILDADNHVEPDFLTRLNSVCARGYGAIQCHRTAKNADNNIAALDGISEEINNSIFRRGHNRLGLSSALIGSGMCFNYKWLADNVGKLNSAVEDREMEALLMRQGIYIHYAEDIRVMDEKVSSSENFQRQRLRWMTGQVQSLVQMTPYLPKAIAKGNINYIDKTLQQAVIPRSILLALTIVLACTTTVAALLWPAYRMHFTAHLSPMKWWLLLIVIITALLIATPARLRTKALFRQSLMFPKLVWHMLQNIFRIRPKENEFIHTTHNK